MKKDIINTLMSLCLNEIHGKDSFLYSQLSKEEVKLAYLYLVEIEYEKERKVTEVFKLLPRDEQIEIIKTSQIKLKKER